jgi:hypothetical protein
MANEQTQLDRIAHRRIRRMLDALVRPSALGAALVIVLLVAILTGR